MKQFKFLKIFKTGSVSKVPKTTRNIEIHWVFNRILQKKGTFDTPPSKTVGVLISGLLFFINCSDKPSEQACIDAHLHNVKIVAQDPEMPEDMRQTLLQRVLNKEIAPAMIQSCQAQKTKKQVECELKSASLAELSLCKKFQRERDKENINNPHK